MLRTVDESMIGFFNSAVQFLNDWFHLTQRRVERLILAVYTTVCVFGLVWLFATHLKFANYNAFAALIFLWYMIKEHWEPKTMRALRRISGSSYRLIWGMNVVLFIFNLLMSTRYHGNTGYALVALVWGSLIYSMNYVTVLDVDGERGRKAKLSMEKTVELFGRGWVPQPLGGNA
jgi:hypothetical protein